MNGEGWLHLQGTEQGWTEWQVELSVNKYKIILIGEENMIYSLTLHRSACVSLGRGIGYGGGQLCIATVQRTKHICRW